MTMIGLTENDDPRFGELAERMLGAAVTTYRPAEVFVVCIDQWFDAKWLHFSGKILGALGTWHRPIAIPPFHPHRVRKEMHFSMVGELGGFGETSAARLHIRQHSAENRIRSVARVSGSAVFFWYSSSTVELDRGSMMLYQTDGEEVVSWYASFHRTSEWKLDRQRGVSPGEIRRMCA